MIRFVSIPRSIASLVRLGRRSTAIRKRRAAYLLRRRMERMVGQMQRVRQPFGEAGNGSCTAPGG